MLLEARIKSNSSKGMFVPTDAVVMTGQRNIIFVAGDHDHFFPREVKLGGSVDGGYRVVDGLAVGEMVVRGGTFLLDAESRLRAPSNSGMRDPKSVPAEAQTESQDAVSHQDRGYQDHSHHGS